MAYLYNNVPADIERTSYESLLIEIPKMYWRIFGISEKFPLIMYS